MTAPSLPLPHRRARLGRYAFWQMRDFGLQTAFVTLVLFGLLGAMFVLQIHDREQLFTNAHRPVPTTMAVRTFQELLQMFEFTAPIIALSGILSSDRTSGYTRFLFAKPLSPLAYYAQSLAVRLIGFIVLACAMQWAWSLFEPPAVSWKFVVDITAFAITIGGMIFVLSALTKYDGLIVVVWMLLTALIREHWDTVTGLRHAVTYLLPPLGHLTDVQGWFLGLDPMSDSPVSAAFPAKWFWWNVGYGVVMFAIGFVILRKRSLTKA